MEMPIAELFDRLSILLLKKEHMPDNVELAQECEVYQSELERMFEPEYVQKHLKGMLEINRKIWNLEDDIRKGKEGQMNLEDVGRRALEIRNVNAERIRYKKILAEENSQFHEAKINHASQ